MKYRIAFCGLGSIGKRHLKNVITILNAENIEFEIDLYRSSLNVSLPSEFRSVISHQHRFQSEPHEHYDIVFITNPTSLHLDTLQKFANFSKSFFIEKPVFDNIQVDEEIFSLLKNKICYVACPLRYNPVLQYIKRNIDQSSVISARSISSSYLPDWRIGQDYRKTYSASKKLGGGVGLDLIHEWDYLTWLLGFPEELFSIQSKISDLEIDSEDIAIYIGKNKNTSFEVHLDYFGRKCIRALELFTSEDTIKADLIGGSVEYLKGNKIISIEFNRNDFQLAELQHFFSIFKGEIKNDSSIQHAFRVLKIAKGII